MKNAFLSRNCQYILLLALFSFSSLAAQNYQKTALGLKTKIQALDVEVQFYSPSVVRILKSPEGVAFKKESLSVIKKPEMVKLKIKQQGAIVSMKSDQIEVDLNLTTGKVSYLDLKGQSLFTEKDNGTQFTPFMDVNKKSYTVRQAFKLDEDESIYGLGQIQNGKLGVRNQTVELKNTPSKVCFPYFLSMKGYGVFWDNYSATTFTDDKNETSMESLGDCSDYYFMYGGSANGVVPQLRALTGQAPMFPLWTFGYWQSKERYVSQKDLMDVVAKYRELNVPLDGIIQDWQYWGDDKVWNAMEWNKERFPDPKGMADFVHKNNAHLAVVAWPGFGVDTKQYKEFEKKNMLIHFETWPPNSGVTPYDPYNPTARKIYWDYLNKGVFSIGVDAWWLDSTEPDHTNYKDEDYNLPTFLGSYRSVVNAFPISHISGIYNNQRATTSDKRVYIFTRSAFVGQQRYAANTWSGDTQSSWDALGKQIPAALNFSLSGVPYWNADIGGFFAGNWRKDGGNKNPEFRELYCRWAQFGAFTPMMRSHGTDFGREIYNVGEPGNWSYNSVEKSIHLRYGLIPYLYATAWQVTDKSASFMYALPLLFDQDPKVLETTDEFMFGTSILVAPVIKSMYTGKKEDKVFEDFSSIKSREVYLPKGSNWTDFWTGEQITGGQTITKNTPIDIIPFYIKQGTILPWGPKVQYAEEKKWDNLEIRVYPGANGEFTLYEDENDNYNYEKGAYSTITFKWNDKAQTVTIGKREGSFKGMIASRTFNIILVGANKGTGSEPSTRFDKTVTYNGKAIAVKL